MDGTRDLARHDALAAARNDHVAEALRADRWRAEEELHRRGAQLAEAQAIAHVGSWEWDIRTNKVTWSDELYRICGIDTAEFKATYEGLLERVHPDDRARVDETVGRSFGTGAPFSFDHRIIRPDGTERVLHAEGRVDLDGTGKPVRIAGIEHDITDRKRAEEALKEKEEETRRIIDTAKDAYIAADVSGRITDWNRQAEVIFGWPRDEAMGRPLAETIIPPEHRRAHLEGIKRFRDTGEGAILNKRIEVTALRRDGSEFPVELTVWPIWNRGSYRFNAFVHDITERRRIEHLLIRQTADLQRSNEDLAEFASMASHDLQEPLRMVSSYMQLLATRYKGKLDADADDFIDFAVDGAARMQTLITDLLTLASVRTAERSVVSVDIKEVMAQTLAMLEAKIEEVDALVTVDPLPTVEADRTQIGQLFQNLISNALKFVAPGVAPRIHIAARRDDEGWRFAVGDNGIGIEPRHAERIFGAFQRLHGRDAYPGTGIGLAMCKRIVDRHGGRIWVEHAPGGGSVFNFTIPATTGADR